MDKIYICDICEDFKKQLSGITYSKFESGVGYLLLRYVLKEKGIDLKLHNISYNEFNKPYIKTINYHYNISHDKNFVCLIISDTEVGIDIEYINKKRDIGKLAKKTFDDNSYLDFINLVSEDEKVDYFYQYWVRFETYVKKIGSTINHHYNETIPNYKVLKLTDRFYNEYYLSTSSSSFEIRYISLDEILN